MPCCYPYVFGLGSWNRSDALLSPRTLCSTVFPIPLKRMVRPGVVAMWSTRITSIWATNPEMIFMPTYAGAAAIVLKQAEEMGIEVPLLGGDAGNDQTIIDNAGEAAEDALCTIPDADPPTEWSAKFKETTGEEPKLGTAHSYDATMVLIQALKEVGEDSTTVKNYLYEMSAYNGLTGSISFDENGDLVGAKYKVLVIKDGQFVDAE